MSEAYLVTGASKGIGRSIAISIAGSGKPVIALARKSPELEMVGAELSKLHPDCITVSCDLGESTDISVAAETIRNRFSHLSGLIHNAGTINPIANMMEVERVDWAQSINVNLIGVQDLTSKLDSILGGAAHSRICLLYTSPSPRDGLLSRMPSSA